MTSIKTNYFGRIIEPLYINFNQGLHRPLSWFYILFRVAAFFFDYVWDRWSCGGLEGFDPIAILVIITFSFPLGMPNSPTFSTSHVANNFLCQRIARSVNVGRSNNRLYIALFFGQSKICSRFFASSCTQRLRQHSLTHNHIKVCLFTELR
ncbi:hypothetical protein FF38_14511 [Lucilia cuprina]|uniref:Uncharacterized protein n=1 Tax=Lucilia cuprina TaxID=7375 RepID=A0A0L0CDA9_LUCCU|nr:hypothetical protein FF38_14511 [Lucilia cuprina]